MFDDVPTHIIAAVGVTVIAGIVAVSFLSSSPKEEPVKVQQTKTKKSSAAKKSNGVSAASRSVPSLSTEDRDTAAMMAPPTLNGASKKKKKKKRNRKKKKAKTAEEADSDDSDDDDIIVRPAPKAAATPKKKPATKPPALPKTATTAPMLVSSTDDDEEGEWKTTKVNRRFKPSGDVEEDANETADELDAADAAKEEGEDEQEEEEEEIVDTSVTVTIEHPSDKVMRCIGKGGATIKEIEAQSQCVIDLSVDEGKITIKGEQEQVDECIILCKNAMYGESQDTIELYNRGMVNIVFGKDFATIRQMQDESGARLDIARGETTLHLSGSKEAVEKARGMVTALIEANKGIVMAFDNAKVGAVYGKGGTNIRSIQERTGTFIEIIRGTSTATAKIMGPPAGVTSARESIQKAVNGEVELKPGEILEEMELGSATRTVVGKGGSKVRELESKYKVVINVESDSNKAKIMGPQEYVLKCKKAIELIATPIWETEKAVEEANKAAACGESPWQQSGIPSADDAEGW